jgi:hypothetical protein
LTNTTATHESRERTEIVLLGVGDVGPIIDPQETGVKAYSELAAPVLSAADIRIAQCERLYSERDGTSYQHACGERVRHSLLPPYKADAFSRAGFDVVSLASNHAMNFAEGPLLDTKALLENNGIVVIGAGRDLDEARQPAILERKGIKVAILAYCSVLREGEAALPSRAGIAPLRARTYYETVDWQPGCPPRVVTIPYEEDLAAMVDDVAVAKRTADAVVLFIHWGVHMVPRVIADYQDVCARAAVNAGADLIVGHHAHVPKAVAVYDGKVCFHSVGNFMCATPEEDLRDQRLRYGVEPDPDPAWAYGLHGRKSLIARAVISKNGLEETSFVPCVIDNKWRPKPLQPRDPMFGDVLNFMEWASEGYSHHFDVKEDGRVVVIADDSVVDPSAHVQLMPPPVIPDSRVSTSAQRATPR